MVVYTFFYIIISVLALLSKAFYYEAFSPDLLNKFFCIFLSKCSLIDFDEENEIARLYVAF